MKRIALGIEYSGTHYHGWQSQQGLNTIQTQVETALVQIANEPITVMCAGRTDAGVHAIEQVVHFDTSAARSDYSWVFGANSHLPTDISVLWAKEVDPDFHARYSAKSRTYRYFLYNNRIRPAIQRHLVGWHHRELNLPWMQAAAKHLLGEHDFSAFRGVDCQSKTPIREIMEFNITQQDRMIIFEIRGNAFLHHMVRNMVGSLIEVGNGRRTPDWIKHLLQAKERCLAGNAAAACGLYLWRIEYPPHFLLPVSSSSMFL